MDDFKTVQTNKRGISRNISKTIRDYSKSQFDSVQDIEEEEQICDEHNMLLEVVCQDCAEKCCYQCGLFGKHKNHSHMKSSDFQKKVEDDRVIL